MTKASVFRLCRLVSRILFVPELLCIGTRNRAMNYGIVESELVVMASQATGVHQARQRTHIQYGRLVGGSCFSSDRRSAKAGGASSARLQRQRSTPRWLSHSAISR